MASWPGITEAISRALQRGTGFRLQPCPGHGNASPPRANAAPRPGHRQKNRFSFIRKGANAPTVRSSLGSARLPPPPGPTASFQPPPPRALPRLRAVCPPPSSPPGHGTTRPAPRPRRGPSRRLRLTRCAPPSGSASQRRGARREGGGPTGRGRSQPPNPAPPPPPPLKAERQVRWTNNFYSCMQIHVNTANFFHQVSQTLKTRMLYSVTSQS